MTSSHSFFVLLFSVLAACGADRDSPVPPDAGGDGLSSLDVAELDTGAPDAAGMADATTGSDATASCDPPSTACGDECVDTSVDTAHCGSCGNVCAEGQRCESGACTSAWTCDPSWQGDGDCDCGCGALDATDCPASPTAADCDYNHCPDGRELAADNPALCAPIEVPAGWTCPPDWTTNGRCDCGCGGIDPECDGPITIGDCRANNGCESGVSTPNPADPTQCQPNPPGWTCNGLDFADGYCHCGCGVTEPDCAAPLTLGQCGSLDGCGSRRGPRWDDPTVCIDNPPQDNWTCDMDALYDGSVCDCGCGALDPDCGSRPTEASCDVVHCRGATELDPENITQCQTRCDPSPTGGGPATCTNGGSFSVGSACSRNLSSCTDGNRYEIECSGGNCECRMNRMCVGRVSGSGCSFRICGWSLVDDT